MGALAMVSPGHVPHRRPGLGAGAGWQLKALDYEKLPDGAAEAALALGTQSLMVRAFWNLREV